MEKLGLTEIIKGINQPEGKVADILKKLSKAELEYDEIQAKFESAHQAVRPMAEIAKKLITQIREQVAAGEADRLIRSRLKFEIEGKAYELRPDSDREYIKKILNDVVKVTKKRQVEMVNTNKALQSKGKRLRTLFKQLEEEVSST